MKGPAIQEQDVKPVGKRDGHLIDKSLKTNRIQMRERKKEMIARQRLNDSIKIQRLVRVLKGGDRLDAFARNEPSEDGHQAQTALVLSEHLHG